MKEISRKPAFVYRDGMLSDSKYVTWLSDVKTRLRQSQIKASIRVNTAMLEFYWSVGRDLVALRAEERWGAGVVKQFALDMRQAFPDVTGFSDSNVKYMKRWYLFYYERVEKGHQVGDLIGSEKSQQLADQFWKEGKCGQVSDSLKNKKGQQAVGQFEESGKFVQVFDSLRNKKSHQLGGLIDDDEKGQQFVDLLEMPALFGNIPWRHHIHIISKCESIDEALFYMQKVSEEGWSRSRLEAQIAAGLFQAQGATVTNFERTLPSPQSQLAREMLKDPYHFDFLSMQAKYDEHDLEEALVANITRFLLELGRGFSYVGRQMELQMPGGQTFFPDLVFYHIPQHRYVIIELKAVKYMPEFAGKLNFYVTVADELLRGEGDNPSVGLIICKSTDKTVVEWSLKDIKKPLGVAAYQLQEVVDRTVEELELGARRKKG